MKALIKRMVWASGMLSLWHRLRNRRTLTIAQFHRVLPADSEAWRQSEQEYALTESEFEACLRFFARHYSVVGLADVLAAQRGERGLPDRALLISFDDGWQDNVDFAEPLLRRFGMRATLFINAEAMRQSGVRWWQDALVEVFSRQRQALVFAELPEPPRFYDATVLMLDTPLDERVARLQPGSAYSPTARQMLDAEGVARLDRRVWDIGSHGDTHCPLTHLSDAAADLRRSAAAIASWCGEPVASVAFPHGRYSAAVVAACREAGYVAVMSSDARLNPLDRLPSVLGRINIDPPMLAAGERSLAYGLWTRALQGAD